MATLQATEALPAKLRSKVRQVMRAKARADQNGFDPDLLDCAGVTQPGHGVGKWRRGDGFGEEDHDLARKNGIPVVCPVDAEGCFTAEVPDWQGTFDALGLDGMPEGLAGPALRSAGVKVTSLHSMPYVGAVRPG